MFAYAKVVNVPLVVTRLEQSRVAETESRFDLGDGSGSNYADGNYVCDLKSVNNLLEEYKDADRVRNCIDEREVYKMFVDS